MDKKTKERLVHLVNSYHSVEKQIGKRFYKLPQRYFWLIGFVTSIFIIVLKSPITPTPAGFTPTDQILMYGFVAFVLTLLVTGFVILMVGFAILLIVITPMINNKIKEAKTIFIDYPKILREGSFNENTADVVKSYLRIVFKEELQTIRDVLNKETEEKIKKQMDLANRKFQKEQKHSKSESNRVRIFSCEKCHREYEAIPPSDDYAQLRKDPCLICQKNGIQQNQLYFRCECENVIIRYWHKSKKHSLIEIIRAYANRIKKD